MPEGGKISAIKQGLLIGTDYDFIYNPKVKEIILSSCLPSDSSLLTFPEYKPIEYAIQQIISSNNPQ